MITKPRNLLRAAIIVILFISIPCNYTSVSGTTSTRATEPLATIIWNPGMEIQEADVGPGQHGTVLFTGVAKCELVAGGTFQQVVVSLSATSEQGWSILVNPPQITFSPNTDTDIPFSVTVTVPSYTSFYITDSIMVSGNAIAYPDETSEEVAPISATIKVNQFFAFSLESDEPTKQIDPGEKASYNFRITNNGNARDTLVISIKNDEQLINSGITVTLSQNIIDIESMDSRSLNVIALTDDDVKGGNYNIIVEVKSKLQVQNEGLTIPKEIVLELSINEREEFDSTTFLFIGAGITAIVIVLIGLLLWGRSRKQRPYYNHMTPQSQPQHISHSHSPSPSPPQPPSPCPNCGYSMKYVEQNLRWYCGQCGQYR